MQLLLLLAGAGTRLRPLSLTRPKCLIRMAGKPVLGHLLDRIVAKAPIDELVLVCSPGHRQEIEDYLRAAYGLPMVSVAQVKPRGQAHAVHLARRYLRGPFLLAFGDTIVEAALGAMGSREDALIFVKETDSPQCHGAVTLRGDRVLGIQEKPQLAPSRQVAAGLYFIRDRALFLHCVEEVVPSRQQRQGETYLADAFQRMIDRGAVIVAKVADRWEDCGEPGGLLAAHRYLLEGAAYVPADVRRADVVVRPPVYIADSALVEASEVGRYVSIGAGAIVRGSRLSDCIVGEGAVIEDSELSGSIVGRQALIRGLRGVLQLLLGDYSRVASEEAS